MADNYKIRYIPRFEEELMGIVDYIVNMLGNHSAAEGLIDEVEKAIKKLINLNCYRCFAIHDKNVY